MKQLLFFLAALLWLAIPAQAQEANAGDSTIYVVTKNDGSIYTGYLIKNDEREVLLETAKLGRVAIPKHEIKSIEAMPKGYNPNVGAVPYASRYFITTNGLPIGRGKSYAMLSWYGPEVQFAAGDNFSLGIITSWVAVPIIGSAKYSAKLSDKVSLGVGTLVGTLSWARPKGFGALGYASVTFGNEGKNLTLSGGYAGVRDGDSDASASSPLLSVAGMARLNEKIAFVCDSFILTRGTAVALVIPGLRFSGKSRNAFQFGLGGVFADGESVPLPVPVVSWFKAL